METLGVGLYLEDLPVGRKFKTFGRTVTEADIVGFVNCTGMTELLFTNVEFLKQGSEIGRHYGAIYGWLYSVFALGMRPESIRGLRRDRYDSYTVAFGASAAIMSVAALIARDVVFMSVISAMDTGFLK